MGIGFAVHSSVSAGLLVMNMPGRAQLGSLLFGRRVREKVTAADLGTGEILEQVWLAQRWMKLNVKVERTVVTAVRRRLVQDHDIGKRHPPQVVEPYKRVFQDGGEVGQLSFAQ